jgi:hypothetical protein
MLREIPDERPHLIFESLVELILRPADTKHMGRQPRTAVVLEDLQDFLALAECVQENGHGADVERVGSEPEQMTGDPVQLGHDDANILSARRRRHAKQLFHCLAITEAIGNGGNIVHAIERRNELSVGLGFA